MIPAAGFIFLLLAVFGGFTISGGSLPAILAALPFEFLVIGGAAIGAFVMANSLHVIKDCGGGLKKVFSGSRFKAPDYVDLLSLLYSLVRLLATKGSMALEAHIEKPQESAIFSRHPKILKDHHTIAMICDYFRMIGMNADDPYQTEDVMGRELKKTMIEEMHPVHALNIMSDGLPALGIVAAVLGVIKTMSHISDPPAVLGEMIGGALVGTFLGVLLAYGLVGPLAARMKQVVEEEARYTEVIRAVVISHLHGNPPAISAETGRKMVPNDLMPTFAGLEAAMEAVQEAGR